MTLAASIETWQVTRAMTRDLHAEEIAFWNGPQAERWVREQQTLDRAFAPFAAKVLERAGVRAGQRVLDVGCGSGTLSLAAADAVGPAGKVVGVDVSVPMLAHARIRAAGRSNVSFTQADAASHRFDEAFDLALSRFGVMFFGDAASAFTNLRRALAPGARFVFTCWRTVPENEWVSLPLQAAFEHLARPAPPGPEDPGPFSFGDRLRVERILSAAGFREVDIAPFDAPVLLSEGDLEAAAFFASTNGPIGRLLREAPEGVAARVREAIRQRLIERFGGDAAAVRGPLALGGAVWMVSASNPR